MSISVAEFVMAFSVLELGVLGIVGLMAQKERPTRWLARCFGLEWEG